MNKNYHKSIISFSLIFIIVGLFFFYSKNSDLNIMNKIAYGGLLSSSSSDSSNSDASSDTLFLAALSSLSKIKIDQELFDSKIFKSLVDNSVEINPVPSGRENPFAPVGSDRASVTTIPEVKVSTNDPSLITSNSAFLNGVISASGVTNGYFKYGQTEELKEITDISQASTNGLFNKSINKLNPKTKYFFKACVKINNIESCGNTISFNTI